MKVRKYTEIQNNLLNEQSFSYLEQDCYYQKQYDHIFIHKLQQINPIYIFYKIVILTVYSMTLTFFYCYY